MATNREKYINNASDEKLAGILVGQCEFCENQDCFENCGLGGDALRQDCLLGIKNWLSQEVEEDIVNIPNIGKMPKTDKITSDYEKPEIIQLTKGAYKDILARLDKIEEKISPYSWNIKNILKRLDKLEKFNLCITKILESHNLNYTKEKTADEMFEELGYKRIEANYKCYIAYERKEERGGMTASERIIIDISHNLYRYAKQNREEHSCAITEAEDKAIHKKIEELKNGK